MVQMNNPGHDKDPQNKELTKEQKEQIKKYLQKMYVGFVFVNWANGSDTKLGTAKQKALQHLDSFTKTLGNGLVSEEIRRLVQKLKKFVSKQIMTSPHSELILSKDIVEQCRSLGENWLQDNMTKLRNMVKQEEHKKQYNIVTDPQAILQMLMQRQMQNAA